MSKDDEAARIARANDLRNRIAGLRSGQLKPDDSEDDSKSSDQAANNNADDETPPCESPREFVERRMRELDRNKR
jgi:hypothetical protein